MNKVVWNHTRLWLALIVGLVVFLLLPADWSGISRMLTAWNAAVVLLVLLTYFWMNRLDAKQMRARYEEEDPTAPVILLVVVAAALLSVIAIVALLTTLKQIGPAQRAAHILLASLTIADSWLLVPTMFTLHYADMFYSAAPGEPPLSFPQTPQPLFWDFVYFSFTIAAACQTADVATNEVRIRKAVIAHSLISFLFNVSILGFAVNVTAGLVGGS
ncbi:MAG: DUF1345 domain-containing protein [Steroidobacteraceae bacterium]